MYGVITGQQTPAQAYNNAFNACLIRMAGQGHTSLAADAELTGYAPGGGAQCIFAATSDGDPPERDMDDGVPGDSEANLDAAKKLVTNIIDSFSAFINALLGDEVISAEDLDRAKTAVNNAKFGHTQKNENGEPYAGSTSLDGKEITIDQGTCASPRYCFGALLHESMHSAFVGSYWAIDDERGDPHHDLFGSDDKKILDYYRAWKRAGSDPQFCPPDEPSCAEGCTSRETAATECVEAGLAASSQRMREMGQEAEDCATDACWNPARDYDMNDGQECGNPNSCVGQSVAMCTQEQPDCMCQRGNRGLSVGAILRNQLWLDYCSKAYDERCTSPTAPGNFGDLFRAPPTSLRTSPATTNLNGLMFGGGTITIRPDGTLRLGRSQQPRITANDPDCQSSLCRASQRGDW